MKLFLLFLFFISFAKISHSVSLFDSKEYTLKFNSENISIKKKERISQIKLKSFNNILKKTLSEKNLKRIENKINIQFVNNFILNMTINDEKIINNNYYSKIKINFNKNLIINYFIKNKINYVDYLPKKFLIIIFDENNFDNKFLTKKNQYYDYLLNLGNENFSEYFLIPKLDFNDRYLLNKDNFVSELFNKIKRLNLKYNTDY